MNKQVWAKYMQEAAAGKELGVGFPTGSLHGPDEVTDGSVHGLQWVHTPTADTSHPVTISIYDAKTKKHAAELYKHKKSDKGDWKEWPDQFPDHGNDYQNVSHCGIQTGGTSGFAMWTQDAGKGTFLIVMTGGSGGINSFEEKPSEGHTYPDGIYLAVHRSATEG